MCVCVFLVCVFLGDKESCLGFLYFLFLFCKFVFVFTFLKLFFNVLDLFLMFLWCCFVLVKGFWLCFLDFQMFFSGTGSVLWCFGFFLKSFLFCFVFFFLKTLGFFIFEVLEICLDVFFVLFKEFPFSKFLCSLSWIFMEFTALHRVGKRFF